MQIMPSLNSELDEYQPSSPDYSYDSSQDAFLDDLNAALSPSEEDVLDEDDDDDDRDSPYNGTTEFFSPFIPEPVRFTSAELDILHNALMADGVSLEAINAIKDMAGMTGGASLDELLGSIRQSMKGGNVPLTEKEVGLLQSLSNRISPENPDKLYNSIRYGDSLKGIDELSKALLSMESSLSQEEVSAIGKALKLSENGIMGLTHKMKDLEGKNLDTDDVKNLFGDAKAEIQTKKDSYGKVEESLAKNLKPIIKTAEDREELARQAQQRESKSVFQSRLIIEDTVVTDVIGDDLNRSDSAGKTNFEKPDNKSGNKVDNKNNSAPINNSGDKPASVNNQNNFASVSEDGKKAENATIANILSEKTNSNSFVNNRAEELKTSDKVFNEDVAESQFLDKKDEKSELNNTQEGLDDHSGKDSLRDDSQPRKSVDTLKYEYAFSSVAQSYSTASAGSSPTGNALGSENALRHTNEVREQVQSTMINMAKNGVQRIEVSLNPVELGQLNIALSIKNGEVSATIQTEKPESASMLNMQIDAIRAELENQGFKVDKIEVEIGLSQEGRQEWQGMDQHNSKRENSENSEYLDRLRVISRIGSSGNSTLAQNMQNSGSMMGHSANSAMTGMHIIA